MLFDTPPNSAPAASRWMARVFLRFGIVSSRGGGCSHPPRRAHRKHTLFVVLNQREDVEAGEFGATLQKGKLHREGQTFDFAAE
jgi:hypothetical protein